MRLLPTLTLPRLRAVIVVGVALAAACRTVPAGPPLPDAASIFAGTAGTGVHVDSIDSPFTVGLERGRWRARTGTDVGHDFWDDVSHLDIPHAERAASSMEERTFVAALSRLMDSDPDAAAVAFSALNRTALDPFVRSRSRVGLTMALTWNSDWESIAAIQTDPDSLEEHRDERTRQAGVERWAHAFARIPQASVTLPDRPITLPLRRSAFGTPVVTVMVNGHPYEFWLDTGASMTLLSADVAVASGVGLAAFDTLALGVVTGHIEARAVYIDSLGMGAFVAHGLTAAVVSREVLRLDQRMVDGVAHSVPIDGVIGADLIRRMDLVIDAAAGTLTIARPHHDPHATRNFFWVGYPVIRLVSRDGQPLLFGLDTGAEGSYVTATLLRKLPNTPIAARRSAISGLGTEKTETKWVVREIRVSDGDYAITLRNTPVTADRRWTFVNFDGVIGSDVALATRLHLDFTNGIFDVRPSAATIPRDEIRVRVTP
jgi:hypothetical protein